MSPALRQLKPGELVYPGDQTDGNPVAKGQVGATVERHQIFRPRRTLAPGTAVRIATHGGRHHADELLAEHVLRTLFDVQEVVLSAGDPSEEQDYDFVLDLGRRYHPESGRFDHHVGTPGMPEKPEERPSGYATSGLVWDYYGTAYICSVLAQSARWVPVLAGLEVAEFEFVINHIWRQIDWEIICPIDRWDLGRCKHHPSVLPLQSLIPFIPRAEAVTCLGAMLLSRIKTLLAYHLGAYEILENTKKSNNGKVYVFGEQAAVVGQFRVESVAARNFLEMFDDNLTLLAVVSPVAARNRWVALFERALDRTTAQASGLDHMQDLKMFFADNPETLLDFIKQVAGFEAPEPEEAEEPRPPVSPFPSFDDA